MTRDTKTGAATAAVDPASGERACVAQDAVVLRGAANAVFLGLTAVRWVTILWFLLGWFSRRDWGPHPVSFVLLTVFLCAVLLSRELFWSLLPKMRRPEPVIARAGRRVGVMTTFVPSGEPLAMLEETVRALVALRYPHETWVLDEGDEPAVKDLCRRLGANHFSRKHRPEYQTVDGPFESRSKHGNYNAWLQEIGFHRYDILTAFDPDHIPRPEFLDEVIGYFDDPTLGYVQVAQAYYNQEASFIARGAAEESYEFYSTVQMASHALGYPVVIGSHNTHRVDALRQVGGLSVHAADDLLITLRYQAAGWRGIYLPRILARGMTPVDWQGYLIQQLRWARSVMDIKFRVHPQLSRHLPMVNRLMGYLQGAGYLRDAVLACTGLALLLYFLSSGRVPSVLAQPDYPRLLLLCAALWCSHRFAKTFHLDPARERGWYWRANLLRYAKWPTTILAIVDVVRDRHLPYSLTRKEGGAGRSGLLFWPQVGIVLLLVGAWLYGALRGAQPPLTVHVIAAVLLGVSLALLLTNFRRFPDAFDGRLLRSWTEVTAGPVDSPDRAP